jgi:hypothetical protein
VTGAVGRVVGPAGRRTGRAIEISLPLSCVGLPERPIRSDQITPTSRAPARGEQPPATADLRHRCPRQYAVIAGGPSCLLLRGLVRGVCARRLLNLVCGPGVVPCARDERARPPPRGCRCCDAWPLPRGDAPLPCGAPPPWRDAPRRVNRPLSPFRPGSATNPESGNSKEQANIGCPGACPGPGWRRGDGLFRPRGCRAGSCRAGIPSVRPAWSAIVRCGHRHRGALLHRGWE